MREPTVGEKIAYRASFLKSIQWHTDVPSNGVIQSIKVLSPEMKIANVQWPGESRTKGVNLKNLILVKELHLEPV